MWLSCFILNLISFRHFFHLIHQRLVISFALKLGDVGYEDGYYQVHLERGNSSFKTQVYSCELWFLLSYHEERAKENKADQKKHCEYLSSRLLPSPRLLPEVVKLKFSVEHNEDFEEGLGKLTKGGALRLVMWTRMIQRLSFWNHYLRSKVDDVKVKGWKICEIFERQICKYAEPPTQKWTR